MSGLFATSSLPALPGCDATSKRSVELIRETPLRLDAWQGIRPDRDDPLIVQLARQYLAPSLDGMRISPALHYAFLWGEQISNFGLSLAEFIEGVLEGTYSGDSQPLYYRDAAGRVRASSDRRLFTESHPDQVISLLGNLGVPSATKLAKGIRVRDAVDSLLKYYTFAGELEWRTMAILYYSPHLDGWRNRWGDTFSFNSIARRLFREGLGTGPCRGTHRLQLATALLKVDQINGILSHRSRNLLLSLMGMAGELLNRSQHDNGGWANDWATPGGSYSRAEPSLHVTGHHLEWMLAARGVCEIHAPMTRAAVQFCRSKMPGFLKRHDDPASYLCPATHAVKVVLQYERRAASERNSVVSKDIE